VGEEEERKVSGSTPRKTSPSREFGRSACQPEKGCHVTFPGFLS